MPQTNGVSQTAAPLAATNTVSLVDTIQSDAAFHPYTNLVEHSLFVPASDIGSSGAGDAGPTFATEWRITGFFKVANDVQISLENRNEPDKKFFLRVGETIPDTEIKIVGVDLRGRAVLLKKGDEDARLEYESEAMPPPNAGKPGAPGAPSVPGPSGTAMQRPPMPTPTLTPPAPGGARSSAGSARSPAPGGEESGSQASRKQSRQQTIARLQQMMQTTTDPAAKQRLQSYIQMLEKANAQE